MNRTYALILAAVSLGCLFSASAEQKSPQNWRSAILKCVDRDAGECPIKVYQQDLRDPADQIGISGGSIADLTKRSFASKVDNASSSQDFNCQTTKTAIEFRCNIASRDIKPGMLSGLTPGNDRFVILRPPYRRTIKEPLKLIGRKYRAQGFDYDEVDDYWRDWAKLEDLAESDQSAVLEIFGALLSGPPACNGRYSCKRYDLLRTPDGVGAVGVCEHMMIGASVGPPNPQTCVPEVALFDGAVWVLAAVKAVPGSIGGCMRCFVCCSLQMGRFGGFTSMAEEDEFREKYARFIQDVVKRLNGSFRSAPWAFHSVEWNEKSGDFRAVSNRRRSSIIDGFEDLSVSFEPIVRSQDEEPGIGAVEKQFKSLEQKDTMAPVLKPKGSPGLYVSIHLEIYVSKYNTVDDNYWIKPSREQEQRFKDQLDATLDDAFERSCKALGFRWEGKEVGAPRCRDPAG
jgi:hypothetical protein